MALGAIPAIQKARKDIVDQTRKLSQYGKLNEHGQPPLAMRPRAQIGKSISTNFKPYPFMKGNTYRRQSTGEVIPGCGACGERGSLGDFAPVLKTRARSRYRQ
jgi:hypothetical protein